MEIVIPALKIMLFFLVVVGCLVLLFVCAGWLFLKVAIFLSIGSVFTGVAYYFYKNMFAVDE